MTNSLANWFSFGGVATPGNSAEEMPTLFAMPVKQADFVDTEVRFIYAKILTDVLERTTGIQPKMQSVLWDSCLQSDTSDGLVTHLSRAMSKKKDLFLVYKPELGTLRQADQTERVQILDDYKLKGESNVGVALSFKNFDRSDMVEFFSTLEFLSLASLFKSANLSKAIQIKIKNLRASVSSGDSVAARTQAQAIAKALMEGKDVLVDGDDVITTTSPDVSPVKEAVSFLDGKRSFYLGMPMSYVNGILAKGLGDSGDADARAVERGLKAYYFSVIKPAVEKLFGITTEFKVEQFANVEAALEVLKTWELIGDEYISPENKLLVVNRILGVDSKLGKATLPAPAPAPAEGGQNA